MIQKYHNRVKFRLQKLSR